MKDVIPALYGSAILAGLGLFGAIMGSDRITLGTIFLMIAGACGIALFAHRRESRLRHEVEEWENSPERIEQKRRADETVQLHKDIIASGRRRRAR